MHILSRQLPSRATSTLGLALRLTQPTIPLTPARLTRSYSHRATTLETMATPHPHNDLARFHALLAETPRPRIMAVCGAGLSASSGLPTFRGAGGLWRNHRSMDLASAEAFERDPGLVWLFYAYRRHMAMGAEPAAGHKALAGMSEKYANFVCVSQNVDDLLERAGHRPDKLHKIHGCLFGIKCSDHSCTWRSKDYTSTPLFPVMAPACAAVNPNETLPLLDPSKPAPQIRRSEIPACPRCGEGLQRPDIVWFGEEMDWDVVCSIGAWVDRGVDIVLSIGTSEMVSTAQGFLGEARGKGAVYVNVNLDAETPGKLRDLEEGDFAFGGDAAEVLPKLFAPILQE